MSYDLWATSAKVNCNLSVCKFCELFICRVAVVVSSGISSFSMDLTVLGELHCVALLPLNEEFSFETPGVYQVDSCWR